MEVQAAHRQVRKHTSPILVFDMHSRTNAHNSTSAQFSLPYICIQNVITPSVAFRRKLSGFRIYWGDEAQRQAGTLVITSIKYATEGPESCLTKGV